MKFGWTYLWPRWRPFAYVAFRRHYVYARLFRLWLRVGVRSDGRRYRREDAV